ncbi:hypothetical protein GQ457_10G005510 [Hibiscus cannabinus]
MGQVARRVGRWLVQGAGSLVGLPGSATNGTVATVTLLPWRRFPTIQDHRSRARPASSPNIGLESPEEVQNASQQVSIRRRRRSSSDRSGHVRPPAESSRRPFSRYRLVFPRRSPELDEKGPRLPLVDLGGLRICGSLHRDDSIHRWESSENAPPPRPTGLVAGSRLRVKWWELGGLGRW